MKIQQVIVDDLSKEQAEELHALFESGDVEKIEAKLRELGIEIPEGAEVTHVERVRKSVPAPPHVITIAHKLAQAQKWELLTEFLDVNARMVHGGKLDPERLARLMAELAVFAIGRSDNETN